jgi:uncharacterized protein (DUF58 family)
MDLRRIKSVISNTPEMTKLRPPVDAPKTREWKYLSPKDLAKTKNLIFAARTIVEGAYAGRHKSPFKGSSPEFVDYREYHPGDEIRTIDWKAYARTDRHFIRLFEKETDMNCYILVDKSASMGFGGTKYKDVLSDPGIAKLDYAFSLAASLCYLLVKQGDKVGLTLFDREVRAHFAPGGKFGHLYAILNSMERQKPGGPTSVSRVLREAFPLYRRRGLLVVISDFLDNTDELFRSLGMYLHRRFEIILFHVLHEFEHELPPLGSVHFIDSETGERVTTQPAEIHKAYQAQLKQFIGAISEGCKARNIDYNLINTTTPYGQVLEKYLLRRDST